MFMTYREPIAESAPHIYVSMLPIMKDDSFVAAHYHKRLSNPTIQVDRTGERPVSNILMTRRPRDMPIFEFDIKFHPHRSTLIIAGKGDNFDIYQWDVETDHMSNTRIASQSEQPSPVHIVALSGNTRYAASGHINGTVAAWDVEGKFPSTVWKHEGGVSALEFSHNGDLLASGSWDGTLQVWSIRGNRASSLDAPVHRGQVESIAFRPSRTNAAPPQWVASSCIDGQLRMWNYHTGTVRQLTSPGAGSWYTRLLFRHTGEQLVCGSSRNYMMVIDVEDWVVLQALQVGCDGIHSLCLSPDDTHVVAATSDYTLEVWNLDTYSLCGQAREESRAKCVAWSGDGQYVVSCSYSRKFVVYEASTMRGHRQSNIEAASSEAFRSFNLAVSCATFSHDASFIASGHRRGIVTVWKNDGDGQWEIWKQWEGHTRRVTSISISRDQKSIVTSAGGDTACVWPVNGAEGYPDPLVLNANSSIYGLQCSPQEGSTWVAMASQHGPIQIWSLETGELLYSILPGKDESGVPLSDYGVPTDLSISSDGTKITSFHFRSGIAVWEVESGRVLHRHECDILADSIAFSQDGQFVASYSPSALELKDLESGTEMGAYGQSADTYALAFSPDSKYLASASDVSHAPIVLHDTASGGIGASVLRRHSVGHITSLTFSSNGSWLLSVSDDGSIKIWDVKKLLDHAPVPALWEEGWLAHGESKLLLWVPEDLRRSLIWEAAQVSAFGTGFFTKVNCEAYRETDWRNWYGE